MNKLTLLLLLLLALNACKNKEIPKEEPVKTEVTTPTVQSNYYTEPHRPQFHFTPAGNWMNDPNGMFFYEGEYHLMYQYYPDSTVWGPMHWGHAVSKDLTHWEHLPIAIYPDSLGYIFSGSAVVDWKNTSGLGKDGQPPLIAMYTYHDPVGHDAKKLDFQTQAIAFSNDKGRTWTKFEGNPVIPNTKKIRDFRDPKVVWDEASNQWVVAIATYSYITFYGSKDLKKWTHLSDFGQTFGVHDGVWECPDLFPIQVEGSNEKKWVLIVNLNPGGPNGGSGTQYFVGDFDGKKFNLDKAFAAQVPKGKAMWLDYGKDNYAGVTWSDVPQADGRRILIGWMSNWQYANIVPTEKWRSATTLPRELRLHKTALGYRILTQPVKELANLRNKSFEVPTTQVNGTLDLSQTYKFNPTLSEIILEIEPTDAASKFGLELSNTKGESYRIGYDATKKEFFSDRTKAGKQSFSEHFAAAVHTAPRVTTEKTIRLHVFFDAASAELFADNGTTVMTEIFFPNEDFKQLKLFSEGGEIQVKKGELFELQRVW